MEITFSPEARLFVEDHGGMLFIHMRRFGRSCCCITLLQTSTEPPPDAMEWRRIQIKDLLVLTPRTMPLPDSLNVVVSGRFRKRVEALWNGCAFVI